MKMILTVITMMVLCATTHAQSCGTAYSRSYSYSYQHAYMPTYSYAAPAKKYVAPVYDKVEYKLVLPVFAVEVFKLNSYGAAYAPAQQVQPSATPTPQQPQQSQMQQVLAAQQQTLEAIKSLGDRLGKVEQRIERIERTRQPIPQSQPKQEPPKDDDLVKAFAAVDASSCAACHRRDNAAKYGGDFVFSELDGTMAKLSAEQREEVERQVTEGKMPKLKTKRAEEMKVEPLNQQKADVIFRMLDRQKLLSRKK